MMYGEECTDESEQNLYHETSREKSLDNDEISAEEEAFMKGYDEASEDNDEDDEDNDEDEDKE